MSMKSIIMSTTGATAGVIIGNYLYEADKKANQYNEIPVPFYTVRKAADDIKKSVEKTYNDIKDKITKKDQNDQNQQEELFAEETTAETVVEAAEEVVEASSPEVTEAEVIEAEVIEGKAVPVAETVTEQSSEEPKVVVETVTEQSAEEPKVVAETAETTIPKFTVTDEQVNVDKTVAAEETKDDKKSSKPKVSKAKKTEEAAK